MFLRLMIGNLVSNRDWVVMRQFSLANLLLIILYPREVLSYASALDISKAFDKIDHGKLFLSLSNAGLPLLILKILINWYEKLFVCVRWNGYLSSSFRVNRGVRQGGKLSPFAFNCFLNLQN